LKILVKALQTKPDTTLEDAQRKLSTEFKDFARLFADDRGADKLPPLRGSLDHAINLREEDGKILTPIWGPLYEMS
jgi:hypothetical protein